MPKRKEEPGMLSRLVSTGLGALLLTEDGVRKGLKPLGLPRDATKYVIGQVERRKDELMQVVRDELHQALAKMPLERIAMDILKEHEIELTVRFVPRTARSSGRDRKFGYRWKSKS